MEDKLYTSEEAENLGFTMSRESLLKDAGWSTSKLHRKMQEMTRGRDYVIVAGATKPTPRYQIAVLRFAGVHTPEAEPVEQTALQIAENKKAPRKSQESPKKVLTDTFSETFTNALILPHKIYVSLPEAKQLTGFPMTELKQFSEIKFGRRVIKKSKLEKIL